MGRQMLMIAGVGGGLYAVQRGLKSIIKAASDAEETEAKFNTVFKNLSDQANAWAESFGKSVGRAEQSVKSWMARLQDTFVPLGIARDEALKLAQSLTTLAVDVASFNNAADADVIRDFTSALVGNHETVRKYGIIISESAMRQEAFNQGIKKSYKELTELEKLQLRYSLILKGTTDAQGDALRTTDSFANQVKRLYANIDDLKVSIGEELLPTFTDFVKLINENEEALVTFSKAILAPIKSILYLIDIINALDEIQKTRPLPSEQKYGRWYPIPPPPIPSVTPTIPVAPIVPAAPSKETYDWGALSKRLDAINMATVARNKLMADNVAAIRAKYIPAIQMEIELTGKLSGARAHARQMMKMENDLKAESLEKTKLGIAALKDTQAWLKRLEGAQRLARIADSIGDAFGRAFERAIFDAEKLRDVMKALMRDIAMAVVRQSITEPWARGISGAISGLFGGGGNLSGEFPVTSHGVPYNPNLQHGGTVLETGWAKVHKGETFSGVQGGGALTVNVNYTGQERPEVTEAEFDFRQMVLNITMEAAQTDGPYRRSIKQAAR